MTRIASVKAHYLRAELSAPFGWSVYTTPIRQALLVEGPEPGQAAGPRERRGDDALGPLPPGVLDDRELQLLLGRPVREEPGLADRERPGQA